MVVVKNGVHHSDSVRKICNVWSNPRTQYDNGLVRLPIEDPPAWGLAEVNAEIQAYRVFIVNGVTVDVDVERSYEGVYSVSADKIETL